MALQTEFEFTLPRGFVDKDGNLHKNGIMRLATAKDEIAPLTDFRVQKNRAYLVIILLARVITKLGTLTTDSITTDVVEGLYFADLSYLQEFYRRVNEDGSALVKTRCPHCEQEFDFDLGSLGGGVACYPEDRLLSECAYIAYHFHWPKDQILDMPHRERHSWVEEISKINKKINQSAGASGPRMGGTGGSPASLGAPMHRAPGAPPSTALGGGFNLTQPDDDD